MIQQINVQELGFISYKEAWDYQQQLFDESVALKMKKRKAELANDKTLLETIPAPTHHFLFCEHPPVFTLGKSGSEKHLLVIFGEAISS